MVGRMTGSWARYAVSALFVIAALLLSLTAIGQAYAADEPAPESVLATLAANMMTTVGSSDYTIECGPSPEMVVTPPKDSTLAGDYLCIMRKGTTTMFGTFTTTDGDDEEASEALLGALEDTLYAAHIGASDINPRACRDFDPAVQRFQECLGAVKGMYTYVYVSSDDIMYVIVSTTKVDAFASGGFFSGIVDFFKDLFGIGTDSTAILATADEFHHGYFAKSGVRTVNAQWNDDTGVIVFKNFVTDFNRQRPEQAEYFLGHDHKQVLRFTSEGSFNFDETSPAAVSLWRKYTSGLRITAIGGTPIQGDVCGDGNVGFDEQCEPTAAGIPNAPPLTCARYDPVSYKDGALKCFPASDATRGCTYDTSACVSCEDNDGDNYYGGNGASGALRVIGSDAKLGMAQPYGPADETFNTLLAARKRDLGITYEIIPINYDIAFRPGTRAEEVFDLAVSNAEAEYNTCVAGKGGTSATPEDKALCENASFSKDATFNPAMAVLLESVLKPFPVARACVFMEDKMVCPDGYSPSAIDIEGNYTFLLERLKAQSVAPIIRITLGACANNLCGPFGFAPDAPAEWKTTGKLPTKRDGYSPQELRRTRAYCFTAAKGLAGHWESLPGAGSSPKINRFIAIGDPYAANISPADYNAIYGACKQGIENALGTNAVILHGLPADDAQRSAYTQTILTRPIAYDGVYVEPPIVGGKYQELTPEQYSARATALSELNISVTALFNASLADRSKLYGVEALLSLLSSRNMPVYHHAGTSLFSEMSLDEETDEPIEDVRPAARYWSATMRGMQGTAYRFTSYISGKQTPAGVKIVGSEKGGATVITIFNLNGADIAIDVSADLNLTDCTISKVTNITPSANSASTVFNGKVPASSIVQIELRNAISCLAPNTGATPECSVLADCNDDPDNGGGAVNPGVAEVCGDGIDNNCDGAKDEQPCTTTGGITTVPPAIECNNDLVCDDGEDLSRCRDCTAANEDCPTEFKKNSTVGKYDILVRSTPKNEPQMVLNASDTQLCKLTNGAPMMFFNRTNPANGIIFNKDGGQILFTRFDDRWQFKSQGTFSQALRTCWGITTTHKTVDIHFTNAPSCFASTSECQQAGEYCGLRSDCCDDSGEYMFFDCERVGGSPRPVCLITRVGPPCFIAGTPVLTPDGAVPIERIAIGDTVVSYDTGTDTIVHATVSNIKADTSTEFILITPEGMPLITTTPFHPFWTRSGWTHAGDLTDEDHVFTLNGWRAIRVERKISGPTPVYNIHIDDPVHDFFAGDVLVHNKAEIQIP